MEHIAIRNSRELPTRDMQASYRAALAVGLVCSMYKVRDETALYADAQMFDPINRTADALSLLFAAQTDGFITPRGPTTLRHNLAVRIVYSVTDVRVQIGASRWHAQQDTNRERALRLAIVDAFSSHHANYFPEA